MGIDLSNTEALLLIRTRSIKKVKSVKGRKSSLKFSDLNFEVATESQIDSKRIKRYELAF